MARAAHCLLFGRPPPTYCRQAIRRCVTAQTQELILGNVSAWTQENSRRHTQAMKRLQFQHDGLTLSYLDSGGDGRTLVALHAHWMEGSTYAPLAAELAPEWRVIALDQRGHGHSDDALSHTRNDYFGDMAALFAHLGLEDAVVLENSLGGVNAYQFAARHPEQVSALIIEDVGVEESGGGMDFVLAWQGNFATREELAERVGPRYLAYLQQSFRQTPGGWKLAFDPRDMVVSQSHVKGDHWADWLTTHCPALLIRGLEARSRCQLTSSRRPRGVPRRAFGPRTADR